MFLNPLMLAGLGGAVLPLVLHLLNRARYRTVDWGAMMFLPHAGGRQQQSYRLKQIALLLLRMAIVAAIAVAMARPLVGRSWAAPGADPRCCAVILVDTSASMGCEDAQGTRLEAARRAALAVLAGLDRADEVNLLTLPEGSDVSTTGDSADLRTAVERVADMHLAIGRTDIADGLSAASRIFQRSTAPNRLIVLICDRQAANWKNVSGDFIRNWRSTHKEPIPRFVVVCVGGEETENVAIDSVEPQSPTLVRDVPAPIDIVVHNYGKTAATGLPVSLNAASGRSLAQTTIDLAPGAVSDVTLTARFGSVGSQIIEAKVTPPTNSQIPGDDQAQAVINITSPLKVLLISGEPSVSDHRGQSDFVTLALAPFKSAGENGADLVELTQIQAADSWPADLSDYRTVILSNVPRVDAAQARRLEQYVFDGGGLLIAPGELVRTAEYNQTLYRDGSGLLPGKLNPAADLPPVDENVPSLLSLDLPHPAMRFLQSHEDLCTNLQIHRYLPIEVAGTDARVLAKLRNEKPAIVEKPWGKGKCLLISTTLGSDWSSLPRSSFLLPFLQSAVRYLSAGTSDIQNLHLDQPIVAHLEGAVGDHATIVLPDGSRDSTDIVRTDTTPEVRYNATSRPGRYEVRLRGPRGEVIIPFVVSAPNDESDLTPLDAAKWAQLQQDLGFTRVDAQSPELASAITVRRGGREMWLTLIAGSLALLVTESALSRLWSVEA